MKKDLLNKNRDRPAIVNTGKDLSEEYFKNYDDQ